MSKPVIVGLGEVLWDVFPDYKRAGGAPANVAFHVRQLGNTGIPVSRVGSDANGKELLHLLSSNGLDISHLARDEAAPTGTVEVAMKDGEASYTIPSDVAWDRLAMSPQWLTLARSADAVCFGTLAQRDAISRQTIREFLLRVPEPCLKVADINLRPPYYSREVIEASLDLADVVKLNKNEWDEIQRMFGVRDMKDWLLRSKKIRYICLTKGSDGAELITPEAHLIEPVYPVEDTSGDSVGVGDAFTAALTHHLLRNSPLDVALSAANRYAAHVFIHKGATPRLPEEVLAVLR